uniref:NADH dehydrogenase subunit 6 n=1 Tax=Proasellus grafi TaxID=1281973 RepID=A0A485M792_9CRUS|nr:NADH dehydrogenase subunit 6 [Proasellus grafi]
MSILLLSFGGLFLASSTPHLLILSLLTSTLLIALTLGFMNSFPWLAYILFLIFLGGILILFTYVSSLSTNHLFSGIKMEIVVLFTISAVALSLVTNVPFSDGSGSSMEYNTNMFMKELFTPVFYPLYLYLFVYLCVLPFVSLSLCMPLTHTFVCRNSDKNLLRPTTGCSEVAI